MAMANRPSHSDTSASATAKQQAADFAKFGEAQAEATLALQKELIDTYEQISRAWLARVKSEADLWSELATKMSSVRSVPDVLGAYQQCVAERMQLVAEDGRRLVDDSQKIMSTLTRAMSHGWPTAAS